MMFSDKNIAVQLYTVRDLLEKDFAGTLKAVADLGFQNVEFAGFGDRTAAEVRRVTSDLGLQIIGGHVPIDGFRQDLRQTMDYFTELGCPNMVLGWVAEEHRVGSAGWKNLARTLDQAGRTAHARGLSVSYHNHSFEFEKFDGACGLDIFYSEASADYVWAELDTYWLQHGNVDPADYIRRYGERCHLLHLKDMAAGPERTYTEVGAGILKWPEILSAAAEGSVEYLIIEHDNPRISPLESIRISRDNLRQLLMLA
ncbi:MAG: sugar phosphate isomerase/epimerase [Candidatus Sumerlaeaceae bacterium]|nr:sugar phosphate isomerase/epimerase [Candidatus Sumerlaeaceae bacterium]